MKYTRKNSSDVRERLMEAAGQIFAEYGYKATTIRKICHKAGAHVGAVNYHFRNKQGLFAAVLEHAHACSVRRHPPDLGLEKGANAEEKLRIFIRSFLLRIQGEKLPDWHGRLIAREIIEHSDALDLMVKNSIQPMYVYLREIIDELLSRDPSGQENEEQTFLCAMSVLGQCLYQFTGRNIIPRIKPDSFDPRDIEIISKHITRFSLAGIRETASVQRL
ncbi:CerR family C-terminal domain-containing protein [Desulfonatronospira sp.]|uniref:CerR family C-terminal domain-containing protein n=1 Tax=Desulfonatronospira sp. TaxID=1962951 RepID=UPI0025B95E2D|nr:CerR family C-terminal domain-containing protein [Desulfonatronospira sp.]